MEGSAAAVESVHGSESASDDQPSGPWWRRWASTGRRGAVAAGTSLAGMAVGLQDGIETIKDRSEKALENMDKWASGNRVRYAIGYSGRCVPLRASSLRHPRWPAWLGCRSGEASSSESAAQSSRQRCVQASLLSSW